MRQTSIHRPRFKDTKASTLLDLIRGVAATMVLLEHWRNMLFVDYSQLPHYRFLLALPYLLSSFGHQAVIIFFILSGYLIGRSVLHAIDRDEWSWWTYLVHRFVRLWVVLIPGLIMCALWDFLGIHFHLAPALYSGLVANHETPNIIQAATLKIFLGNIFFLQTIAVPVFGSDQALWSLANEFWYYILFPLGLLAFRYSGSKRLLYLGLLVPIIWIVRGTILELFPIWLGGVALARVSQPIFPKVLRHISCAAYILVTILAAKLHSHFPILDDYIFASFSCIFIWIILSASEIQERGSLFSLISRKSAAFSYSLYVVHMPFCLFLAALAVGENRWVPAIGSIVKSLAILGATIAYAYVFAMATEFKTDQYRKRIEERLCAAKALFIRHSPT